MAVESLVSRLAELEASHHPLPTALHFNVRSTAQVPVLSSSPVNSHLVDYRAGLSILDVEADILSKSDFPLSTLLSLAILRADIANKLHVVQEHVRHMYSINFPCTRLCLILGKNSDQIPHCQPRHPWVKAPVNRCVRQCLRLRCTLDVCVYVLVVRN
jgi:hypothetical protein